MVVVHPPCTPRPSCVPSRCHPTPSPCKTPERCLKNTASKGLRHCQSAVSIVSSRSRSSCPLCGKKGNKSNPTTEANKLFKRKAQEALKKRQEENRNSNRGSAPCCVHRTKPKPKFKPMKKGAGGGGGGGCIIL